VYVGSPPPVDLDLDVNTRELSSAIVELTGHVAALLLNGRPVEAKATLDYIDSQAPTVGPVDWLHLQCLRLSSSHMLGDSTAATLGADRVADLILIDRVPVDDWVSVHIPLAVRAYSWEGNFAGVGKFLDMIRTDVNPLLDLVDVPAAIAFAHYQEGYVELAASEAAVAHETAVSLGAAGGGVDVVARSILGSALVDMAQYGAHPSISQRCWCRPTLAGPEPLPGVDQPPDCCGPRVSSTPRWSHRLGPCPVAHHLSHDDVESARRDRDRDSPGVARFRDRGRAGLADEARMASGSDAPVDRAGRGRLDAAAALVDPSLRSTTPRQRLDLALAARLAVERRSSDVENTPGRFELGESTARSCASPRPASTFCSTCGVSLGGDRVRSTSIGCWRLARCPAVANRSAIAVEELSAREVIILRYIATSMSYQEIAESLFLSLNTVKTHVKHVLRKLSASSRAEAVRRAQELHYL
jgi:DNA-binding CsgD family transcriptional regulator